jgi:signal transduction histidine kinase/tetratricopeptide (TPR) repeat protein
MEPGLDWQKKATIIFAITMSLLSILLTIFAIRAAERERLVAERDIEEEQRRLAELILGQVNAAISELEGRIDRLLLPRRIQPQERELAKICERIVEGEEIVTEVFLINEEGQAIFPLFRSLFLSSEESLNMEISPVEIETHSLLERAETYEFRTKDYPRAIESYQELMDTTPDSSSRAMLTNRIGRCYKKCGDHLNAIETYQVLSKECAGELSSDGIPFGVIAQCQIGMIHLNTGEKLDAAEALLELCSDLLNSKWTLSKSQFNFYITRVKSLIRDSLADINGVEDGRQLTERWNGLMKTESERLNRANIIDNLRQKIIPLIRAETPASDMASGGFHHVSETIGNVPYLVSYTSIVDKMLGIMIDPEVFARKLLPLRLNTFPLRKGWYAQITDKSGNRLAGEDITGLKDPVPQLTFSSGFDEDFPPWKVVIYQSDPGSPGRSFNMKRNIYVLSVAVVISSIIFAGVWAIRSMGKELELAKLKSEFVSTVSHELRTPLASIRYLAELLQRGRVQQEDRKQRYYETIVGESGRLSRLIENILDFSKIEAGMKEYRFEDTDVAGLVRDILSRFQTQVTREGGSIESEISDTMPEILADREAISQALFNVLDNALKYSGESAKISVSAWSDEDNVFLQVQDEGIGISVEEQKKVFEKFYRSERLQDSSVKGSGIGLTLVSHIIKAHGGQVLLESDLGKGTKLVMKLPVRRKVGENG